MDKQTTFNVRFESPTDYEAEDYLYRTIKMENIIKQYIPEAVLLDITRECDGC